MKISLPKSKQEEDLAIIAHFWSKIGLNFRITQNGNLQLQGFSHMQKSV